MYQHPADIVSTNGVMPSR